MSAPPLADKPTVPAPPSIGSTLGVFLALALATLAIDYSASWLGLSSYTQAALAVLFLVVAVQGAQRGAGGLAGHGLWLGGILDPPPEPREGTLGGLRDMIDALRAAAPSAFRETSWALLVAAITFPPFVLGFYVYNAPSHAFSFQLPESPLDYMASQLLVVALPEEALFRGYLQTRLSAALGKPRVVLGFVISIRAVILQAALFALLHFAVDLHPERLAVFFPALLFGCMREARGGIGAAVVYHALCNLLGHVLARGWL